MRIFKEESGQALLITALFTGIVFLGVAALAIDVGMLYRERRIVQTAADAGALAAAVGESKGTNITTSADAAATQNGLNIVSATPTAGQATVTAVDGIAGKTGTAYVQVTVTNYTPTFFMGAFNAHFKLVSVSASAQASYLTSSNGCVTGLSPTGSVVPYASGAETNGSTSMTWGTTVMSDVATEGNSKIIALNCGVVACGPASEASGNGKTAAAIYAWDSGSISALSNSAPSYGTDNSGSTISAAPTIKTCSGDPLASSMPAQPTPGSCIDPSWMSSHNAGGSAETISPGTYCNFNSENVSTLTMNPGVYIVTNTFSTNSGSTIKGSGVTIVLANGAIANSGNYTYVAGGATPYGVGNGTTMDISAPTSGTYANIAIWDENSSASTPDTFTFGGGASSTFTGAIYAPNTNLVLGNGSGTSAISSNIVANTIMVLGGSTIQNNYQPTSSGAAAGGVNLAQ